MNPPHLFDSFLQYRESLQLARWLKGLLTLQDRLEKNSQISEQLCYATSFNSRQFAPNIKPPEMSAEEFKKMQYHEKKRAQMTDEEKHEELQTLSQKIHEDIQSGKIDLWDETPILISNSEVENFLKESLQWLNKKIRPACNPNQSFLEKLTLETLNLWSEKEKSPWPKQHSRGLQQLLTLWDHARIEHEGEPPYKIVFSKQVEEALGIDGELESLKLQNLRPLNQKEKKKYATAAKLSIKNLPHHKKEIQKIEGILMQD